MNAIDTPAQLSKYKPINKFLTDLSLLLQGSGLLNVAVDETLSYKGVWGAMGQSMLVAAHILRSDMLFRRQDIKVFMLRDYRTAYLT